MQANLQGLNQNDNLFPPNRERIPSIYQYPHKGSFELPDIYRPIPNQFPDGSIFPSFYPNPYGTQGISYPNYYEDQQQIAEPSFYQRERKYSQPFAQIPANEQNYYSTRNMVFLPYPSTYQNGLLGESIEIPQPRDEKIEIGKINKANHSQNSNINNPNKINYHENVQQVIPKSQNDFQQMGPIEQLPNILGQQNNIVYQIREEIPKEVARKSINKKTAADKRIRIKGRFVTTKQAFVYMGVSPLELASNPLMDEILKDKLDYSIYTTCKNGIKIRNLQTLIKKAISKTENSNKQKVSKINVRIKYEDPTNKLIEIELDRPTELIMNSNLNEISREENKIKKYEITLVDNPIFECSRINVHDAPMDHLDYHINMKGNK